MGEGAREGLAWGPLALYVQGVAGGVVVVDAMVETRRACLIAWLRGAVFSFYGSFLANVQAWPHGRV